MAFIYCPGEQSSAGAAPSHLGELLSGKFPSYSESVDYRSETPESIFAVSTRNQACEFGYHSPGWVEEKTLGQDAKPHVGISQLLRLPVIWCISRMFYCFGPSSWHLRISLESVAILDVWGEGNSSASTSFPLLSHMPSFRNVAVSRSSWS